MSMFTVISSSALFILAQFKGHLMKLTKSEEDYMLARMLGQAGTRKRLQQHCNTKT
jgi:hypothetical protein